MKELVEMIAKSIVDQTDMVRVNEVQGKSVILELSVADEDMGKIIGTGKDCCQYVLMLQQLLKKVKVIVDIQNIKIRVFYVRK